MQEHLKERLTGAIILLVLVVLLVPEMFRGQPAARTDHASASSDELPLRSYTIDLRGAGTAPSLAAGAAASPAPVNAPPVPLGASAASRPSTVNSVPAAHEATNVPPAASAAHASVSVSASAAGHSLAKPPNKGQWIVQVATYTRRDFAEHLARQLRAKGFVVVVAGPDDRGRYRVRSAPLADQAGAAAVRQKLLARGLRPIVVTAP